MTAITRRQVEILRIVFAAKRPNVRAIADRLGSPNRLSGDLVELIQKRYLHMEREGKEHIYTITKPGVRCLAKNEADDALASIGTMVTLPREDVELLRGKIAQLELAVQILQEASGMPIKLKITNPPLDSSR